MDLINECERRFDVDEWMVNGIRVWPVVRVQLYEDFYNLHVKPVSSRALGVSAPWRRFIGEISGLLRVASSYASDRKNNDRCANQVDVLLLSNGVSFDFVNGQWYDRFCDPFVDILKAQGLSTFIVTPGCKCPVPRKSPSMYVQPMLDLARAGATLRALLRPTRDSLPEFADFCALVRSSRCSMVPPNLGSIRRWSATIEAYSGVYERVLRVLRPRIAMVACYYSLSGMALNLATRRLGAVSVDIQHGVQGDLHAAYGSWTKVPPCGYELLPKVFWCWSEREVLSISRWAQTSRAHRALAGGNLYLLRSSTERDGPRRVPDPPPPEGDRRRALYTLSGDESGADLKVLAQLVTRTRFNTDWWIRCHPCKLDQRKVIKKLLKDHSLGNAAVDLPTDMPLYGVLNMVDVHVTEFSTVTIEARAIGVPTVLTNRRGGVLFADELSSGWAVVACTVNEIVAAIDGQVRRRPSLSDFQGTTDMNSALRAISALLDQAGIRDGVSV
jgi:hypothetical protein